MVAIAQDIEITNAAIADALSVAAMIRSQEDERISPWVSTAPQSFGEALAETVNLGASILGRDRNSPFGPGAGNATSPGAQLELAQFNASILVTIDFLSPRSGVSSASISFGVRSKTADVVEDFAGVERALMLQAGLLPMTSLIESGNASSLELGRARDTALRSLEYGIAEYAAVAQHRGALSAAA